MRKYLYFDTETTGLLNFKQLADYNTQPHLVQLSWLGTNENHEVIFTDDYIIKPNGFEIPEEASKVHGITTEIACDKGVEPHIPLNLFVNAAISADVIFAHNTAFDVNILLCACMRLGAEHAELKRKLFNILMSKLFVCTAAASRTWSINDRGLNDAGWPKRLGLSKWYERMFGEKFDGAHNSLYDTIALQKCTTEVSAYENFNIDDMHNHAAFVSVETNDKQGSAILAISVAKQNLANGNITHKTMYVRTEHGVVITEEAFASNQLTLDIVNATGIDIKDALSELNKLLLDCSLICTYNGFTITTLTKMFNKYKVPTTWGYRLNVDIKRLMSNILGSAITADMDIWATGSQLGYAQLSWINAPSIHKHKFKPFILYTAFKQLSQYKGNPVELFTQLRDNGDLY